MNLQLIGSSSKKIELADSVFLCDFNGHLVHQVVTAYLSAGRAGTKAQKTRSDVSGGGAKPWNQKGSGRARAGTSRSPLWRKGGVVFAARPRNFEQKVNKKMYRGALKSILSELIRQERLMLVENFAVDTRKTKDLLAKLDKLKLNDHTVLIITEAVDENLYLASRNVKKLDVRDVAAVDPAALVGADKVLITVAALKQYEEMLK